MRSVLVAFPVALLAVAALAHGGATGIVKERMDQMGDISKAMKTMAKMVKGEVDYDAAIMRTLAAQVSQNGGEALNKLFPKHSMDPPTEARREIWQDWDTFEREAIAMQRAALELSQRAEEQTSAFKMFGELAGTCKACHDDFRIKK